MTEEKKPRFTWEQKKSALVRQLRPHRASLLALGVLEIAAAISNGVVPYLTGKFFDTLITPRAIALPPLGEYPAWLVVLAAWAAVQVLANAVSWVIDRRTRSLTTNIEASVQANAYIHLLTLPTSFHKTHRTGEITDNLSRAGWMLQGLVNTTLSIGPQFLTVIIGVVICFAIYPLLALLLLAGVGLYAIVLIRILPETARYQEEGFKVWNRAVGDAQDAYTNVSTVKQAGAEQHEKERILSSFYEKAVPLWSRMERAWSNLNSSQRIIVTLTQGGILLASVYLVGKGAITIGDLIAFNAYAGMIMGPFAQLGHSWQTAQNGLVAVTRAETVFGAVPEIYEPENAAPLSDLRGEVAFKDVRFSYESDQPEVLKGVSFTAAAGQVVALVGETGAGKSTIADLVSGYYFPTAGSIHIDGHDIRTVSLSKLRSQIGIVPQEVVLFNASIKENIGYGMPGATDEEIKVAAVQAKADEFIERFPQKYEQEVGERGIKLSVGQKQRIAIARAMLRNPRILILDEPTSALDSETEKYITTSFEKLMQGRTTFVVAHRLSTVRKADKIILLKEGVVAEEGTHAELMSLENGSYRRMYELHIGLHE